MSRPSGEKFVFQGLNLLDADVVTEEELRAFREFYVRTKGAPLPGLEFWIEHRPDVLKRQRLQVIAKDSSDSRAKLASALSALHYYAVIGFYEDGILYEMKRARAMGARKEQIVATIAVAFLHGGPLGMRYVASAAGEYLRGFEDPEVEAVWPENWKADGAAFRSGMDFSQPSLTAEDLAALRGWYLRVCGEVPPYVEFLGANRPELLKAFRNRFESAIGTAMPKQMMPVMLVYLHIMRGNEAGIREAMLMGRGFGMTKAQMLDAIFNPVTRAGPSAYSTVEDAAGDVLASWPVPNRESER